MLYACACNDVWCALVLTIGTSAAIHIIATYIQCKGKTLFSNVYSFLSFSSPQSMPVTAVGVVPEKELTGRQADNPCTCLCLPFSFSFSFFSPTPLTSHLILLFSGMFKHYLITRLSEQDEVLRARYIANEKIFALVLGIVPEGNALPHVH